MKHNRSQKDFFKLIEADLFENEFLIGDDNEAESKFPQASEDEIMSKASRPLSIPYFSNIDEIDRFDLGDLPIECFLIKDKGLKPLNDIGILTLSDFALINDYLVDVPGGIEKIGNTGHRAIQEQFDYFIANRGKVSLMKFMDDYLDEKQRTILNLRYGLTGAKHTLEETSSTYKVTRERIRQIEKKALERLRRGIEYGLIDTRVRDILFHCAEVLTPISEVPALLADYNSGGLIYLYSAVLPEKICLYKNDNLNHVLLFQSHRKDQLDKQVAEIREYLSQQIDLVSIEIIQDRFQCNHKLIMSLAGLVVRDGVIALKTNKRALGESKLHNIIDTLRAAGTPMSIDEIASLTNYVPSRVRNIVSYSDEIVNVGQSIYALKEQGYFNLDTDGMMRHLLTERAEPILISEIMRLVKEYRKVTDSAVYRILTERPETFQQLEGGYVALREWGHENEVEYISRRYTVPPAEAILGVLEEAEVPLSPQEIIMTMEMMYGEETSLNPTTVYAALRRLENEGSIEKSGDSRATFYELM